MKRGHKVFVFVLLKFYPQLQRGYRGYIHPDKCLSSHRLLKKDKCSVVVDQLAGSCICTRTKLIKVKVSDTELNEKATTRVIL